VRKLLEFDPKARVIVSSGYSNDPIMANYRHYGFCEAISKPYRNEELRIVVQKVLAR
jgi:FixJ family two-component response regulator